MIKESSPGALTDTVACLPGDAGSLWSSPKLPVDKPHLSSSLSPWASLATFLTGANREVDVIKPNPGRWTFSTGLEECKTPTFSRILCGGIGV